MVCAKLVIVYGAIGLVERVGSLGAAIVCQSRCNGHAGARQQDGFATYGCSMLQILGWRSTQELSECSDGAGRRVGVARKDDRRR